MGDRGGRRAVASLAVLAVGLLVSLAGTRPAGAESVTADQLRTLAERAASDPASLSRLRQVDQVDGRPVDLGLALEGAEGEVLQARLRMLAGAPRSPVGRAQGSGDAREEARQILDQRKFKPAPAFRPFRGILRQLGEWLEPLGRPFARLWDRVSDNTPARVLLVAAVIGLAVLASVGLIRRRTAVGISHGRGYRDRRRAEDPDDLERQADAAEARGDLELAFRLRFRAGLLRLDRAGVIAYRPALTTGELTRRVPSPRLRGLASAFEEIAYGGRPADAGDLQWARAEWPRVLEEVGQR